ncbi:energy transducer TonB [Pedobacter mendelii]|uniref:Biopolymer transporter TonB n=1 Tax=Pedobacter mendelii TaxID=1908240 RepID=A0ABQ2BFW3_9SPHI|nr:energy transducer TonB [Pedobacter mendelii]GGI25266.1 biopolymer transporter TonB [Pedobacter mendelii]
MFNSSFNLYKTEWLDLVFSGRNKNYGAYVLRMQSSSILTKSLFIASSFFVLLFVSPMVYIMLFPKEIEITVVSKSVDLTDVIHEMKKPDEPKKAEPEKAEPIKVKTIAVPSKIIVTNDAVLLPPTMADVKDAVISSVTQDGIVSPNAIVTDNKDNGSGVAKDGVGNGEDKEIYITGGVDEYPEFEGGMKAWAKYMERNLKYPYRAQEEGVQGKVFVSFVVEKDGSITDVQVLKGIGFGCDEEAIKVIKKSPLWKAGRNKGNPVRVRYNIPINFTLAN